MIPERLTALREEMKRRSIDIYVVPTADFHESEYVGEHFKARKFITGFTGSAGTAVITLKEAGLWTDGRYFVQAEKQLEGSTVTLYRMAEEGVPTVEEFVKDKLPQGGCIGLRPGTLICFDFQADVLRRYCGDLDQPAPSCYQGARQH